MKPKTPNNDSTRYRDAFLFMGIFYLEVIAGCVLVLVIANFLSRFFAVSEFWVSFILISIVIGGLLQLGLKVKRNIFERGLPPWGVVAVFAGTMLAPGILLFLFSRTGEKLTEGQAAALAVYEAEQEFMKSYRTYSLSLTEIGIKPREGKRAFAVGFAHACALKFGVDLERALVFPEAAPWVTQRKIEVVEILRNLRGPVDCVNPREGFEAFALGVTRENGPLEVWKIDEKRHLVKLP